MTEVGDDSMDIEKLYEYGERLNEAKDKSQVIFQLQAPSISIFFFSL